MTGSRAGSKSFPGAGASLAPEVHRRLGKVVLEVFSTTDFHRANLRAVAKKARVSFTTIYKHFGSKEGLLFAFVDEWLGVLTQRMVEQLRGADELKEKLRKVFRTQLEYYEANSGLGRIMFMTVPLTTWMDNRTFAQKEMIGIFLETLRQGQAQGLLNPRVRAEVLLDLMHGLVQRTFFMWIYRGRQESLAGQADLLFDMAWRAIANPQASP